MRAAECAGKAGATGGQGAREVRSALPSSGTEGPVGSSVRVHLKLPGEPTSSSAQGLGGGGQGLRAPGGLITLSP